MLWKTLLHRENFIGNFISPQCNIHIFSYLTHLYLTIDYRLFMSDSMELDWYIYYFCGAGFYWYLTHYNWNYKKSKTSSIQTTTVFSWQHRVFNSFHLVVAGPVRIFLFEKHTWKTRSHNISKSNKILHATKQDHLFLILRV